MIAAAAMFWLVHGAGLVSCMDFTPEVSEKNIPDFMQRDETYIRSVKSLPPNAQSPLIVNITLSLESITEITTQFATFDLYMTELWNDGQNRTEDTKFKLSGTGIESYCWTTDTYYILAKKVVYFPVAHSLYFEPDGLVIRDRKVRIKAPCTLSVFHFPFDNSKCRIVLSSYAFDRRDLRLSWTADGGVHFPYQYDSLSELGFEIKDMNSTSYTAEYGVGVHFDVLEAAIYFKRLSSVYLYQVYVPAASLVVMSWVPFWLTEEKCGTPARASIGVMTVLSMLTICSTTHNIGGAVSRNPSLLDIYIWVSFGAVILAMLQFAMADFYREDDRIVFLGIGRRDREVTKRQIDGIARWMFPLIYGSFNAIYWAYVYHIKRTT